MENATKETIQKRILQLFEDIRKHGDDDSFRAECLSEIIFLRELLTDKKRI